MPARYDSAIAKLLDLSFIIPPLTNELLYDHKVARSILELGGRMQEVTRCGESVRTDRSEFGQLEMTVVHFADVATRSTFDTDTEDHATLNHADVTRCNAKHTEFGTNM